VALHPERPVAACSDWGYSGVRPAQVPSLAWCQDALAPHPGATPELSPAVAQMAWAEWRGKPEGWSVRPDPVPAWFPAASAWRLDGSPAYLAWAAGASGAWQALPGSLPAVSEPRQGACPVYLAQAAEASGAWQALPASAVSVPAASEPRQGAFPAFPERVHPAAKASSDECRAPQAGGFLARCWASGPASE